MNKERELINQIENARKQNQNSIVFIDDEGKKVEIKVEEVNPDGICEWWDE